MLAGSLAADSLTELAIAYLDGTCPADQPGAGTRAADQAGPAGTDGPTGPGGAAGADSAAEPAGASGAGRPGCGLPADRGGAAAARRCRLAADRLSPLSGALLDVGTTVHDPPAALRRLVLTRDGGCTQPICGTARVDLDRNVPFSHEAF
ncbi:MAG: hypothetical protein WKF51_09010 [Geodermatophilaceae bacterium]